jgi:hypothetical protein
MFKFMIFLLLAAFAGLFFVNGPNGSPMLTIEDFTPEMPSSMSAKDDQEPTMVTRWKDENGVWQFSNRPQDSQQGEVIELDGDINTMPSVDTSILSAGSSRPSSNSSGASPKFTIPSGLTTVSGDQAQQMMDTVTNLQQTVDDRKAELDKLSGQP